MFLHDILCYFAFFCVFAYHLIAHSMKNPGEPGLKERNLEKRVCFRDRRKMRQWRTRQLVLAHAKRIQGIALNGGRELGIALRHA